MSNCFSLHVTYSGMWNMVLLHESVNKWVGNYRITQNCSKRWRWWRWKKVSESMSTAASLFQQIKNTWQPHFKTGEDIYILIWRFHLQRGRADSLRFTWMRNIVKPVVIFSISKKCLWRHPGYIPQPPPRTQHLHTDWSLHSTVQTFKRH